MGNPESLWLVKTDLPFNRNGLSSLICESEIGVANHVPSRYEVKEAKYYLAIWVVPRIHTSFVPITRESDVFFYMKEEKIDEENFFRRSAYRNGNTW